MLHKDGLKDVIIVTAFDDPNIDYIEWVFYQMDNGLFYSSHLETD